MNYPPMAEPRRPAPAQRSNPLPTLAALTLGSMAISACRPPLCLAPLESQPVSMLAQIARPLHCEKPAAAEIARTPCVMVPPHAELESIAEARSFVEGGGAAVQPAPPAPRPRMLAGHRSIVTHYPRQQR
jgi:hypothetical protein